MQAQSMGVCILSNLAAPGSVAQVTGGFTFPHPSTFKRRPELVYTNPATHTTTAPFPLIVLQAKLQSGVPCGFGSFRGLK